MSHFQYRIFPDPFISKIRGALRAAPHVLGLIGAALFLSFFLAAGARAQDGDLECTPESTDPRCSSNWEIPLPEGSILGGPNEQFDPRAFPDENNPIDNPNRNGSADGIFNEDGNSGSAWVKMLRGNGGGFIADPGASQGFANGLRIALMLYSNALLIVASVILLYHLLVMVTETAHQGVVGGKRANQLWAPIRLVIAVGLLVPLASGLNSGQYITLQVIEWGSNMATKVWDTFLAHSGEGSGSTPVPRPPDVSSLAREAAKIGACKALINNYIEKSKGSQKERIQMQMKGGSTGSGGMMAMLWGNEKSESLCGSIIIYAGGAGAAVGTAGLMSIMSQMEQYAPHFLEGNKEYNQDPGGAPEMMLAAAIGAIEGIGSWNNAGGSAGAGWVSAGSWFLALASGGSNAVSGTDTLPIVIGPKSEQIRPEKVQQAFYGMAEWIVGKYKKHKSGGAADPDMMGNTVAGRKFVDLMMLFLDQMGVISGLWAPGSIAFYINLGNSPLAELVDLGHRMIRTALDFVGEAVELGVNEPQHAMYSSQYKASDGSKAFGPKAGLYFAMMAVPILAAAASALLTMGIQLGIFMPLLPFAKFVLSVMTWLLSVVECLVCVPLLALAWLTPYGEGFAGQKVEPGYWLIIHTFLRPVKTIFGLVCSILLFNVAAYLVTMFYYAIASNVKTFNGAMFVVCKISFGMMYVSILYVCLNAALKAMDAIGRHAVTWMGGKSHEENLGDAQAAVQMAKQGTAMFSQGLSQMSYAALNVGMTAMGYMRASAGGGGGGGGGAGGAGHVGKAPGNFQGLRGFRPRAALGGGGDEGSPSRGDSRESSSITGIPGAIDVASANPNMGFGLAARAMNAGTPGSGEDLSGRIHHAQQTADSAKSYALGLGDGVGPYGTRPGDEASGLRSRLASLESGSSGNNFNLNFGGGRGGPAGPAGPKGGDGPAGKQGPDGRAYTSWDAWRDLSNPWNTSRTT